MASTEKKTEANQKTSLKKKLLIAFGIVIGLGIIGNILEPEVASNEGTEKSGPSRLALAMRASTCEDIIKRNLKNPPSYRKVERQLFSDGTIITYRATNGFGGTITNKAKCTFDGDYVKLVS